MNDATGLVPQTVCAIAARLAAQTFPHWAPVTVAGGRALVSYRFNGREHERRVKIGLGAVTSPDVLRLLVSLPLGERVRSGALTSADRRRLRTVGEGAIASDGPELLRLAVPAVETGIALVPAESWRKGLEAAGGFTPFCARAMVLRRVPRDVEALRMEADFYGIGVIVADSSGRDGPSVLVPSAPFVRERFSVGGWLFLEQLYATVRQA
ncbi:hypothetical protein [Spirillospora sp. CA-128828]|uniref:hypothetical protein n=1 Tax=Spirillospora sp. CA-128828 TaxID=3240033 RepID=UPI003D8ECCA7